MEFEQQARTEFILIDPKWDDYHEWECYKNGMYESKAKDSAVVNQCISLLSNKDKCYEAMRKTTIDYPVATRVKLSNRMFNPISWLGQATCNNMFGATMKETIFAWVQMTSDAQFVANAMARKVIHEWRENETISG